MPPWTREKPTEPGWYWVRMFGPLTIVRLGGDGVLTWDNGYRTAVPDGYRWAGPIPMPHDDPKEGGKP